MRALAVVNKDYTDRTAGVQSVAMPIDGEPVTVGMANILDPRFEPSFGEYCRSALVRTNAFSSICRDRGFITPALSMPAGMFIVVGFEFVGSVEAVSDNVRSIRHGDRHVTCGHAGQPQGARRCTGLIRIGGTALLKLITQEGYLDRGILPGSH